MRIKQKELPLSSHRKFKTNPLRVAMFTFLVIWSLSFAACLLWLIINSLKHNYVYMGDKLGLPAPGEWQFVNYINAFKELQANDTGLLTMLFNTLWLTTGNIFLQVFSSITFSYVIARFKFPGRNLIYWVVIARMMISLVGTLPATYQLYNTLGIYDSPLILITNLSGTANFLIYYATFKGVPNEFAEAAYIDGYNHVQIFFKVMLPQVTGVIIATAVTSFIANWNEYLYPIMYLPHYPTLASGIYYYQKVTIYGCNYPMLFAALIMTMIPCIVVFCIFQDKFLSIDIGGGLKG